jgi:hypothetical protein
MVRVPVPRFEASRAFIAMAMECPLQLVIDSLYVIWTSDLVG